MPLYTDNYRLWIIRENEPLDPLEDSKRFYTIDRQLFGLFEVFGNGVLSGWNLSAAGGLAVSVSPGSGFINYTSGLTDSAITIEGLQPNSTSWIYVEATTETRYSLAVNFFSDVVFLLDGQQVLLGQVTTDASGVTAVDSSLRQDISYLDTIKTMINSHRHRGGSANPSKIDLTSEVMGQLPSYRIGSMDASVITTGKIPASRIPLLNHSSLQGIGVLSHAQLDAYVRNLSDSNVRLLGELGGSNLLQLFLAHKHYWNDVDKHSYNLLNLIPGISPDEMTDFTGTTAVVDTYNHTIQGVTSGAGSHHTTQFSTVTDFEDSQYRINLDVYGGTVPYLTLTRPTTELIVENFANVFQSGVAVPGWTLETLAENSSTSFESDSGMSVDGTYSGQLNVDQGIKLQVTKLFLTSANWQAYNEIEVFVNTVGAVNHGIVNLEILGGSLTTPVTLLEVPMFTSVNEETTGWKFVSQDISTLARSSIVGIRISTTSSNGWDLSAFVMNVDKIRLNNNLYYSTEGRIRFRYKTPQISSWLAITWDADLNGGEILSRARTASSYEVFNTSEISTFSPFSSTAGYNPGIDRNRCVEIEMVMRSDPTLTASPKLRSVTVTYLTQASDSTISVSTQSEFDLGEYDGTSYVSSKVTLPTSKATHYYWCGGAASATPASASDKKIWDKLPPGANTEYPITINTTGIPKSAWMALISSPTTMNSDYKNGGALWCPTNVQRLSSTRYLVADTLNDRVMIIDGNGKLSRGYYSNSSGPSSNNSYSCWPTTACYNPRTGRVQITLNSTHYTIGYDPPIDVSMITLLGSGGFSLTLANDTYVWGSGTSYLPSITTYINDIIIELSNGSKATLDNYLGTLPTSQPLYVLLDPKTFYRDQDNTSYKVDLTHAGYVGISDQATGALNVFIGDYTLINGIHRPVCVSETTSGNWLVCNCQDWSEYNDTLYSLIYPSYILASFGWYISGQPNPSNTIANDSSISSIMEIDLATDDIVYTNKSIYYNLFTRGCAYDLGNDRILVAGMYYAVGGTPSFQRNSNWRGTVRIINKTSGVPELNYTTDYSSPYYYYPSDAQLVTEGGIEYVYFTETSLSSSHTGRVTKIRVSTGAVMFNSTYSAGLGFPLQSIRSIQASGANFQYVVSG
jgi:hypothetical protein